MKKKEHADATKYKATYDIRIRFNETDPLGIVWHGYYIHYFEDGREAFGRKYGISYLDVQKNGYATPIVKSLCEHKLPLRYGEIATIETTFVNTSAAKMIFLYKILNAEGNIVCTGETVQVFVDDKGELSLTNPPFFEIWKQQMEIV
ncbi:acyl-CoA thioesterase [Aquimarina sediminis]|uniref:acyl-CoA thioesterase n=1 Tax=Aquimarina sediminis TaxID=2070536 RepID=UPI000CA01738|nr:acyl-CoA thioesterase [Aquimarina sediminis]